MPLTTIRFSRQREAVLQALRARCDHPTAETLYNELRRVHSNISLGTVYRNLTLLENHGDIVRLQGQDGPDRYDGAVAPHDHLHCRKCGAVVDLPDLGGAVNLDIAKQAAQREGIVLESHQTNFFGLCGACVATGSTQ